MWILPSTISQTDGEFKTTIAFWCNFDEILFLFFFLGVVELWSLEDISQDFSDVTRMKAPEYWVISWNVCSPTSNGLIALYLCIVFPVAFVFHSIPTRLTLQDSSCINSFFIIFKILWSARMRKIECKYSRFWFPDSPICYTERAQAQPASYFRGK